MTDYDERKFAQDCTNENDTCAELKSCCAPQRPVGDALLEAHKIVNGNRQNEYGKPEDSFRRIADYWELYLQHIGMRHLESADVANMMVLFKMAREEHEHKHDNYVDMCGYAALADNMYPQRLTCK